MFKSLVSTTLTLTALTLALPGQAPVQAQSGTIVATAVAAGSFKTLAKALEAADLVKTLEGPGPFTVFAPTDEAFAKLPAGTVENLLKPENKEKLKAVLTYHVVPGRLAAADILRLAEANGGTAELTTLEGGTLQVRLSGDTVTVEDFDHGRRLVPDALPQYLRE